MWLYLTWFYNLSCFNAQLIKTCLQLCSIAYKIGRGSALIDTESGRGNSQSGHGISPSIFSSWINMQKISADCTEYCKKDVCKWAQVKGHDCRFGRLGNIVKRRWLFGWQINSFILWVFVFTDLIKNHKNKMKLFYIMKEKVKLIP